MNKSFLFRLTAITFFCLASLAIKSETSMCDMKCTSVKKNNQILQSPINSEEHYIPAYPYESFLIKI